MNFRLIPVLLVDRDCRLVKTERFGRRTYVGDPLNVVRLFNEMEVDELCILDIDASHDGRSPNFEFIRDFASECFMPLAYGGGISTIDHALKLNKIGVEKFILGRHGLNEKLVTRMVSYFGSQAVVACLDHDRYDAVSPQNNVDVLRCARLLETQGVGEIILQSIERDGVREGYDLNIISKVAKELSIPVVALGGAGTTAHLMEAIRAGASAAASGSAFVFVGRLRAVLVSYPSPQEQIDIMKRMYLEVS